MVNRGGGAVMNVSDDLFQESAHILPIFREELSSVVGS